MRGAKQLYLCLTSKVQVSRIRSPCSRCVSALQSEPWNRTLDTCFGMFYSGRRKVLDSLWVGAMTVVSRKFKHELQQSKRGFPADVV